MNLATIDTEKLKTFYIAAQTGKFTITAEKVNLDHSVVSRQIQTLEKELNAVLFHRNGRQGLTLTEKGEALFPIARDLFAKIAQIEPTLSATEESISGPLRIWVYSGYALNFVRSCLVEFAEKYPLINLHLISTYDFKDVTVREADVAIGLPSETLKDTIDVVQEELFSYKLKLYAKKKYVEKFGLPKNAQELKHHRLISFTSPTPKTLPRINWYLELEKGKPLEPYFTSNSPSLIKDFIEAGMGIGSVCPNFTQVDVTNLIEILPHISGPQNSIVISYGENFKSSKKIQALHKFLKEKSKSLREDHQEDGFFSDSVKK